MLDAAQQMDAALFLEYWRESVPPDERIPRWLDLADRYARDWVPSQVLFKGKAGGARAGGPDSLAGS